MFDTTQPFCSEAFRRVSSFSAVAVAMAGMSVARQFRVKFGAATLQLKCCEEDARSGKAVEHTAAIVEFLRANKGKATSSEQDSMVELITLGAEGVWPIACQAEIIGAVEEACCAKRRRDAQCWGRQALNVFTEAELVRFKEGGLAEVNNTLSDIIARIKSLGGVNLCEHDKKLFAAMWLHFRGDGIAIGKTGRDREFKVFGKQFTKAVKDFKHDAYLTTLPSSMEELKLAQPALYHSAYDAAPPVRMPAEDVARIMLLDNAMNCRGLGQDLSAVADPGALATLAGANNTRPPVPVPAAGIMDGLLPLVGVLLQQFTGMQPGAAMPPLGCPGLEIYGGGRTAGHAERLGHPMRKHPGNLRRAVTFEEDDGDSTKEVHPAAEAPVEERRDSLGSVRKRMLARAAGGEEDSESEEPAAALPLPKKGTPKKVKATSTPTKVTGTPKKVKATKKTAASTPTKKKKSGPSFSVEHSRQQVLCRSGLGGKGGSWGIKFADVGGKAKAIAKATAWLAKAKVGKA